MPEISVAIRLNTGHFVDKPSFLVWCFEFLQEELFAAPTFDAVCLQPPSYVGNRKSMMHGRFERSSWELEVLEMQSLCAGCLSQSCAVSLRSIGRQCFHYTQGSDENGQQGTGVGRASLLLELPAQPCWSCLSACPVCCWPLPQGMLSPRSAVSLHPSLLPTSSSRAYGWVWWRRAFAAAQVRGWFKCAGALAGWAHRKSTHPQPWACQLCNSWAIVTGGLSGQGSVPHWINLNIFSNVFMCINVFFSNGCSSWTTNCKGSNVTPLKQRRQAKEIP